MSYDLRDEDLANYRALITRIDEFCATIAREFAGQISCRAGCSGCCLELTLFPVEAVALLQAMSRLPHGSIPGIDAADRGPEDNSCPLLVDGLCLVYADRPLICRTHGYPLIFRDGEATRVDFCPENFQGVESIPGSMTFNLELINQALVAINEVFLENVAPGLMKDGRRRSISEIITLWKGLNNDAP